MKKFVNLARESVISSGTGTFVLGGAVAGHRVFAPVNGIGYSVGEAVPYEARHGNLYEIGNGTMTANGIARTDIEESSNGNQLVDFPAGAEVFCNVSAGFLNGATVAQLPDGGAAQGTDVIEIQRANGQSFHITVAALWAAAPGGGTTPGDSSVPALTAANAAATGATTGTGGATVGEANGTLYCLVSTSANATQAQVEASTLSQVVNSTGAKTFDITGLLASTPYYLHFMHKDAAGNKTPVASASFTTQAAGGGGTAYTIVGYNNGEQGPPATVDASGAQVYGTKKLAINRSDSAYYNITPAPPGAVSGWSTSNTVPPEILEDPNTNYNGGGSLNGAVPMGALNATTFKDMSSYWPTVNTGTQVVYLWIKPTDGAWYCVNPSGTVVSGI